MHVQDKTNPTGVAVIGDENSDAQRARNRKANAAVQMKIAGATWDEIAETLGYPSGRAALVATEQALERELRTESKDAMRAMAGKRLERMLRSVWPKAINSESPEQLPAVGRAREIIADHRKLFGLDAPTEFAVSAPAEAELQRWVAVVQQAEHPALDEADIFEIDVVEEGEE